MDRIVRRDWNAEWAFAGTLAIVLGVFAVFAPTGLSMVEAWERSNTYSHCFIVLPAFVWMLWRSRFVLLQLPARPWWPALPLLAGAGLIWLAGDLIAASAPRQFALVAMVPLATAAVLGTNWVRALAFPFAFLFLAVPFGDSLVPVLMDWTADFTVAAIRWVAIPVYREGTRFTLPSGSWTVVESCSGIRYLFACITLAALYAWVCYRSPARRALFLVGAVAVAIVANWIRAFSIVMIGHLHGLDLAVGVDHMFYGWLFFCIVMTIVFSLGELWRTRVPEASFGATALPEPDMRAGSAARRYVAASSAASLMVLCLWPLLAQVNQTPSAETSLVIGDIEPRAGWARDEQPVAAWKPVSAHPLAEKLETFVRNGQHVAVHLALYGRPSADSKLASSENRLVPRDSQTWREVDGGVAQLRVADELVAVRAATLVSPEGRIVAWRCYWVNGALLDSPTRAMLAQISARLRGRSEVSALVTVFRSDGRPRPQSPDALEAFLADMLPSIDAVLHSAASATLAQDQRVVVAARDAGVRERGATGRSP